MLWTWTEDTVQKLPSSDLQAIDPHTHNNYNKIYTAPNKTRSNNTSKSPTINTYDPATPPPSTTA